MLSPVLLHDDLSELSQQQLDDALVELCAHMNAAEYRLLEFVGEYDSRGLEGALGVRSLAHWLNYRCGIDLGAAREKVRVARALRELPAVREAFAAGTVSYSKVRAITRVATPANEGLLLGYAKAATASQLEQIVRGYRRMERLNDPDTVLRQQRERGLRWWIDEDGSFVIEGRFPPEEGALILRALEAVQARTYREEGPDATADTECPAAARRGDALVRLVEAGAANEDAALSGGERTLVVVHVQAPTGEPSDVRQDWLSNVRNDLLAGLVVALALIPEAIAFSIIAGVDPKVGLYASFCIADGHRLCRRAPGHDLRRHRRHGGGDGGRWSKEHGLQYLLAATCAHGRAADRSPAGCNLGSLMRFVSRSVITGFVNALAILIFMAQLPELIGVTWEVYAVTGGTCDHLRLPLLTKAVPSPLVAIVVLTGGGDLLGSTSAPSATWATCRTACPCSCCRTSR
jgi:hypothetical protein